MELNEAQKRVVGCTVGPLLVIAGAGTGKTRVITERIKHLLEDGLAAPEEILALTFTQKASEEMINRLSDTMPLGYTEPWVSTFHRFADRLLQENGLEIGLDPSYKIIPYPEQYLLIRENLFDFNLQYYRPLGNPAKFIGATLKFFSRLQDENITSEEFLAWETKQNFSTPGVEHFRGEQIGDSTPGVDTSGNDSRKHAELASAYQKYSELKLAQSKMDFGDLILSAIKLFRERPSILAKYQTQFKYVLVDEFQDTNFAQFELIKLLCPSRTRRQARLPARQGLTSEVSADLTSEVGELAARKDAGSNLIVVGDDDQAIYRFRGASLSNILDFRKTYPQAETVVLTQNYRSTQEILDASYRLIQNNNPDRLEVREKIDKKLVAKESEGRQFLHPAGEICKHLRGDPLAAPDVYPTVLEFQTGETEADGVVKRINEVLSQPEARGPASPAGRQKPLTFRDFAILARSNSQLDSFVAALRRAGVPYQLLGNRGLFDQEEVKNLVALLRFLSDPQDSASLFKVLSGPMFDLDSKVLQELLQFSRKKRISLWESLENTPQVSADPTCGVFSLANKKRVLEGFLKDAERKPVSRLLYEVITALKYVDLFIKEESIENQLKLKNINLFFDKVKQYESAAEESRLHDFVDWLEVLKEAGDNPAQAEIEDVDTVNLLTVHAAKGLEFDYVFLVNLVSGRFPSRNRSDAIEVPEDLIKETLPSGDYHLQEERRLFYVGCTRAKKGLFLTYALDYGGARTRQLSGFIGELGLNKSQISNLKTKNYSAKLKSEITGFEEQMSLLDLPKAISNKRLAISNLPFVSYSQLETFKQCPLKYRYRYVLGIPTLPSHVLNFGQTLHRTLRDYHRADLFQDTSLKRLLEVYAGHFKENDQGYDSARHKQMRFEDGQKILKSYFKEHKAKFGIPLKLEQKFTLNIAGTKLLGSIDRIDQLPDGGYEVIDYKTGSDKKAAKVDADEQLTIYALACRDVPGIVDAKKASVLPESLALYFLETGEKAATKRTSGQLDEKEEIVETIGEIKLSDFPAKPSILCHYCDFKDLCSFYKDAPQK